MLEPHGAQGAHVPSESKLAEHESAAHQKRNWVRLTYDCNNHCVFCLDTLTHDGQMRDKNEVKEQILGGKRKGAERLILSGGEPTIHPNYVDFIRLGALAGYDKIQTVTNGRLFSYPDFLGRCLDAGLGEITFSVHGPNARIHDALVGVKGAFDEEVRGIELALADGRPIVNIDIVINRANVKHIPEMLDKFIAMGVREYDLLQVIPFGNAFTEGRDVLFYDLDEMQPYLQAAFAYSKRPDIHMWLNRFPVQHLEGYEHLIQDPYKLNDEVRGRKEEYKNLLYNGVELSCRQPARCRYCYLQRFCDTLDEVRATVQTRDFTQLRVDTGWEAKQEPVFGGDPAAAKRGLRLPMHGEQTVVPASPLPPAELAAVASVEVLLVVAPDLARALEASQEVSSVPKLALELEDYTGLATELEPGDMLRGKRLKSAVAKTPEQAAALLAIAAEFEVVVLLNRATEAWLLGLAAPSARLSLRQPAYERLTESSEHDLDLPAFFGRFLHPVPVEGVPACMSGRPPRAAPKTLDTAMMTTDGRLEIFRYAKRYIGEHYRAKSLRCRGCAFDESCQGMHINYVRAHGYSAMKPVTAFE